MVSAVVTSSTTSTMLEKVAISSTSLLTLLAVESGAPILGGESLAGLRLQLLSGAPGVPLA